MIVSGVMLQVAVFEAPFAQDMDVSAWTTGTQ